jgi:hypothetical protein
MTGEQDVKKARGFIGVVTRGYLDRAEAYGHIAKMTIGLWYGANSKRPQSSRASNFRIQYEKESMKNVFCQAFVQPVDFTSALFWCR